MDYNVTKSTPQLILNLKIIQMKLIFPRVLSAHYVSYLMFVKELSFVGMLISKK